MAAAAPVDTMPQPSQPPPASLPRQQQHDKLAFSPLVCVVDFHHHRGPEIEHWIGTSSSSSSDPAADNDWGLIPYMALPDGAHASAEEFSYFTLVYKAPVPSAAAASSSSASHADKDESGQHEGEHGQGRHGGAARGMEPRSVFGMSCCHQIASSQLLYRPADVTRSAVQKAVVVITDKPQRFSALREKLSVVTRAWFAQRDFRDLEILQRFQESLAKTIDYEDEGDQYFGLSLREIVHHFKWQTLVLFKCLLLQPKVLFFGSHCERICQVQFTLISLIPGLIRALRDCADPQMDRYAETLKRPDSVRTSDRASLLTYMGLPLQLFGKGSIFGPYTPLQQLDILADFGTKSYVVGSTNSLLLQQKDRYADVLVHLDENTLSIQSPSLRSALTLTTADRRWIDFLTQAVNDTWDETDPSRPRTHGYAGSEEFIRLQFEEYLLALLSATKYHNYLVNQKAHDDPKTLLADVEGDPAAEFSLPFLEAWHETENYKLWDRTTDSHLFDIVEPRHPCAGGLTIEDVQRRLTAQVAELHLDERFASTKETVNKRLADGQVRVTSAFNKVWADIEVMREAQRKRSEDARAKRDSGEAGSSEAHPNGTSAHGTGTESEKTSSGHHSTTQTRFAKPDLQQAQATVQAASQRAGAYLSSWGSWAAEKRKQGWRKGSEPDITEQRAERPKVTTVSELEGKDRTIGH